MKESPKYDVVIIGAGAAGLAARRFFIENRYSVLTLEKSRGVGGRMATRRLDEGAYADHGAQFLCLSRHSEFESLFHADSDEVQFISMEDHTGTTSIHRLGISRLAKLLLDQVDDRLQAPIQLSSRVVQIQFDRGGVNEKLLWRVTTEIGEVFFGRSLLLTAPIPQALELLQASQFKWNSSETLAHLQRVSYQKCIALVLTLAQETQLPAPGILKNPHPLIDGIYDQRKKGLLTPLPTLVIHASAQMSERVWSQTDDDVKSQIWDQAVPFLKDRVPIPEIRSWQLHRWRYSVPTSILADSYAVLHHSDFQPVSGEPRSLETYPSLFLAGDSFKKGSIEGALTSGFAASKAIAKILRSG